MQSTLHRKELAVSLRFMRSIPERQLEVVYQQLARTAGFRGFRPAFLLTVSVMAACATAGICLLAIRLTAYGIALTWIGVAAAIALDVAAVIVLPALRAGPSVAREAARGVLTQMLPPLGVGIPFTIGHAVTALLIGAAETLESGGDLHE